MKIRKLESGDIPEVVELWYETCIRAHDFISPDYWKANMEAMATVYLPDSETYLAVEEENIIGFITMVDNYLAAIFIQINMLECGIGTKLLNFIKNKKEAIQLAVYKKNSKSINFYKKHGFQVLSENLDKNTNEIELLMEWNR
ncbi:GNAT family N-acetyltransferase [Psychrilyobacter atlanticus]|uniref:GNAT family N-acetyltransferase n=1 Tax=Psychrilyobacter atlanticus TaxID=271091 RepID=UPI00040893E8|nr:GNAT family N-acetyltransferase [Psychrilyobacter atlanticus]